MKLGLAPRSLQQVVIDDIQKFQKEALGKTLAPDPAKTAMARTEKAAAQVPSFREVLKSVGG